MDKKTLKALQRHDLVEISDAGRRRVFAEIAARIGSDQLDKVRHLIVGDETSAKIPGIVRREDNDPRPGMIPVGFVSPFRLEGNRMRIAAFVAQADINALISPTAVLRRPFVARTPCLKALADIAVMAITIIMMGETIPALTAASPKIKAPTECPIQKYSKFGKFL